MTLYTYVLAPLQFIIESNCDSPQKALQNALQSGSSNEVGLLKYLHANIEDYPTLNGSVTCIEIEED